MSASAKYKTRHFLAYSKLDALLIAITIAHFAIILWAVSQFSSLPILYQLALGLMLTFLILTQYHVVMHNFIHTRFFGSQALNRLYAILCTITTMNVFTEAEIQHLTHHVHVNDRKDTATGVPKDPASTFRYGADGNHENILSYSILSPIREIFESPEYSGRRVLAKRRIVLETSSLWIFWLFVFVLNWRFGVFYMGVSYVGQVLSSVQNYFEHYGATPGNRKAEFRQLLRKTLQFGLVQKWLSPGASFSSGGSLEQTASAAIRDAPGWSAPHRRKNLLLQFSAPSAFNAVGHVQTRPSSCRPFILITIDSPNTK